MFHVFKWNLIAWTLCTLLLADRVLAESSSQRNENLDVYSLFHDSDQPEQLIEDFHINLQLEPAIDAHFYMTDQKEPFNNPVRMEIILSCNGQAFTVNRDSHDGKLKTFCDFSRPKVKTGGSGPKVLQILLFQFDENTGECPPAANVEETLPLNSIIELCRTLE